ncbi:MAG TPA: hypothetical protein DDW49_02545 [Deltaproteobacteria bacterium]|nr:hypothetical protein [Deltaproteobacteria bacterium]
MDTGTYVFVKVNTVFSKIGVWIVTGFYVLDLTRALVVVAFTVGIITVIVIGISVQVAVFLVSIIHFIAIVIAVVIIVKAIIILVALAKWITSRLSHIACNGNLTQSDGRTPITDRDNRCGVAIACVKDEGSDKFIFHQKTDHIGCAHIKCQAKRTVVGYGSLSGISTSIGGHDGVG